MSASFEAWLRRHWEFRRDTLWPGSIPIELTVRAGVPPVVDSTHAIGEISKLDGVELSWTRLAKRGWFSGDRAAGVRFELTSDGASIEVWSDSETNVSQRLLAAVHVALCEALRATGLVPLHAAVVTRNAETIAFTGLSGVGKSSTLVSAVAQGWTPIAEDFAWLDATTRRVYGWDRGVHLNDDGLARLRETLPREGWQRERDKQFIAFDRLTDATSTRRASPTLTRLVELRRDALRDSSVERLDSREAVRALWEGAGVPLCQLSRRRFAAGVPALLRHIVVEQMILGRTAIPL